jgi:hypothetical protein
MFKLAKNRLEKLFAYYVSHRELERPFMGWVYIFVEIQ